MGLIFIKAGLYSSKFQIQIFFLLENMFSLIIIIIIIIGDLKIWSVLHGQKSLQNIRAKTGCPGVNKQRSRKL